MATITRYSSDDSYECSICNNTSNEVLVAHSENKHKQPYHPFHESCLKTALLYKNTCPECRIVLNANSFVSKKQRVIHSIKTNLSPGTDIVYTIGPALIGALVGAPLSASNPLNGSCIFIAIAISYATRAMSPSSLSRKELIFTAFTGGLCTSFAIGSGYFQINQ